MKLLLLGDEDFNHNVLERLKQEAYDVTSIKELGLDRQWFQDEDVLKKAIELNRVVLTHNKKHFIKLHRKVKIHTGIITCYQTTDYEGLVVKLLALFEKETEFENKLFRVYKGND